MTNLADTVSRLPSRHVSCRNLPRSCGPTASRCSTAAEDHYPQGGLGAAVLEALAGTGQSLRVRHCAVSGLPGSGTPEELMEAAGISASHIAAARALVTG